MKVFQDKKFANPIWFLIECFKAESQILPCAHKPKVARLDKVFIGK